MPGAREEIYTIDSTMYYDYFYLYNLEIIPNSLIIILNLYIVPIELQNPFFIGLPHAYFCIAILCSHFSFTILGWKCYDTSAPVDDCSKENIILSWTPGRTTVKSLVQLTITHHHSDQLLYFRLFFKFVRYFRSGQVRLGPFR